MNQILMMSNPEKQSINGIFLLNKPQGLSSNTALQKVKRLLNAKKAGHTGSLDPLATGMLPICLGEATKVCQYLLDADKCYEATGLFGIKTDTSDATGSIIQSTDQFNVSLSDLEATLADFLGETQQTPSMYSALKHNGRPLYHFARKGINLERASRSIHVRDLSLKHFDGKTFSFSVICSKGTYIRNLIEDIGDALLAGAHMTQLHRVYTAGLSERLMYSLEDLERMSIEQRLNCLIPMDEVVGYLDAIVLSEEEVLSLRQGKVLSDKKVVFENQLLRLYNQHNDFIGLGELQMQSGLLKAKRLLAF
jgi:tRNA pseudouridine55 synthase